MTVLLIAEHDNKILNAANYHTLTAAQQLDGPIDFLIIGYECESVIQAAQKLPGIRKIRAADHAVYAHQLAENCAELIAEVSKDYQYVLTAASTFGKNCLPRAAALLDVALVSDVVKVVSPDTFERYIYAGNALATIITHEPIKLLTIRPTTFAAAAESEELSTAIEQLEHSIPNQLTKWVSQELTQSSRPELTSAKIVVAGGRGLKSAENFKRLEKVADHFGAAIGASRAAVDAGFAPNDYQVGQTGKVVAPDLYMAFGISGAIQHLAGMKDSKVIVAINNDPEAPIFAIADYGLVADLFDVLEEIENSKG